MHPHAKPPWWPEGEPWPPERWHARSWRRAARRRGAWGPGHWGPGGPPGAFARRFGCFVVLLGVVLASVGVLVLFVLASVLGFAGLPGPLGGLATPAGIVGTILGVIVLAAVLRTVRSISTPLGALGEAAGRVEEGDYSVRVQAPERGPRELRRLVTAFNAMAERLEAEDATRRRLLADVSHELRTPLAVIQGNLEALLDGVYPPDEAHIGPVLDETRILERLIDDLRTLSLAEAGALPLHREPTSPAVLLEDVATAHRARAGAAGIELRVEVPTELPMLDADPVRVRQVVANLVDNAIRAMPNGGTVVLTGTTGTTPMRGSDATSSAGGPGRTVRLAVVDDGPGIPDELRASVFERFTKSATSRGSGLGLAIARAIVEAHGGTIGAAPGPGGRGTAVTIDLPVDG